MKTTVSYVAPETADGAALQVEQLEKAINDGVKYIVLTTVDYKKINESGLLEQHPDVKVVCHDRFVFDNPRIAFFSSTNTKEIGRTQAQFLIDQFQASGKDAMTLEILQGPAFDGNSKDYYDGAIELLQKYIDDGKLVVKSGKQTMTIDKNLKDMANNTAMIVNGLITNKPITGSQTVAGIPTIYSKITVITKDDF